MPIAVKSPTKSTLNVDDLVSRLPGLVTVYDAHTGDCVYANKAIETILGYHPADMIAGGPQFAHSIIHPDDLPTVSQKNKECIAAANKRGVVRDNEPVVSFEYRIRRADGGWVWLHTEGSIFDRSPSGSVKHILNVSVDITKRKETEADLRQRGQELEARVAKHTERLELALEASQMGTWEWNIKTDELIWSPEMMKLYGLDPNEQITIEKFFGALHPDDREMKQHVLQHAAETGESYQVEHRCVWADGSVHWILGQGKAFMKDGVSHRMVGTAMNIDLRKATEAALEASQLRYKTLFDSTIIGIVISDVDGHIHEANQKWLDMTGYTKRDISRGNVSQTDMTPPEYLKLASQKTDGLKRTGEIMPWEREYICKDQSRLPVIAGTVLIPKSGNLCVTIMLDITERQKLIALNKAKDEFISIASHQLRTPATGVKQYIGMLLEGYAGELTPEQHRFVETAYESNERQLKIVNDLLHVARIDTGTVKLNKSSHDIVKLIQTAVDDQCMSCKKRNQTVQFKPVEKHMKVLIDEDMIFMAIENLLDNAAKYSPDGSVIHVSLSRSTSSVIIKIKDHGVGIAEQDLGKLYQKFSRLDNPLSVSSGGTGLGLYWVKRVLDAHSGSISVDSKVNEGSTFTIKLPRA